MSSFLNRSEIVPAAIAVVGGVLSWDLVRLLGNRREAWDDPHYWQIGYPLLLFTAFILAMGFPERPWRRLRGRCCSRRSRTACLTCFRWDW